MAKHRIDGKGSVSKGLRISSSPLKKEPKKEQISVAPQRNSSMREAFDNILIKNIKPHCRELVSNISSSLNRKVGLIRMGQGWNAHLSKRTAIMLNADKGFMFNQQPFTRYDGMLIDY